MKQIYQIVIVRGEEIIDLTEDFAESVESLYSRVNALARAKADIGYFVTDYPRNPWDSKRDKYERQHTVRMVKEVSRCTTWGMTREVIGYIAHDVA